MVRDVRDHTFSSLDCLWSLRKGVILPRALGQYELMTQRYELDSNAHWTVVRASTWAYLSVWLSSDVMNYICSKFATPLQFLPLFSIFFDFFQGPNGGKTVKGVQEKSDENNCFIFENWQKNLLYFSKLARNCSTFLENPKFGQCKKSEIRKKLELL